MRPIRALRLIPLCLLPAAASASPGTLIDAQLSSWGLGPIPWETFPPPPAPRAVPAVPAAALFPDALWSSLAAPDAAALKALSARVPGLNAASVRTLTWEAFEPILAQAAASKLTVLDLFTDEGLRGTRVYHVPADVLAKLDAAYDLNSVCLIAGTTVGGAAFRMEGVVMGAGKAVMLYDRDDFTFAHPVYKGHGGHYTLASVVTETILGPGEVAVEGLSGMFGISVRGIVKTGPEAIKIRTAVADADSHLYPIAKRP